MEDLTKKLEYFKGRREEIIKCKRDLQKKIETYKAEEAAYFGNSDDMTMSEWVEIMMKTVNQK